MKKMDKKIVISLIIISLIFLMGCRYLPYTDGSCGSLCVQKECRKEGANCGINGFNEILSPSPKVGDYCVNYCYDGNKTQGD